jgi:hypothetical protein
VRDHEAVERGMHTEVPVRAYCAALDVLDSTNTDVSLQAMLDWKAVGGRRLFMLPCMLLVWPRLRREPCVSRQPNSVFVYCFFLQVIPGIAACRVDAAMYFASECGLASASDLALSRHRERAKVCVGTMQTTMR